MNMQVMHFLTAFCASIRHDAKAAVRVGPAPLLDGKFRCQHHHPAKQGSMLVINMRHRQDMQLGNHQEMNWRPRIDIMKSENFIVLIDPAARNRARDDFAKNTVVRMTHRADALFVV